MGGAYGTNLGDKRNAFEVVMGKCKGLRIHGRPRHGWEDNINCSRVTHRNDCI
jgi:hypothetical protein